MVRQLAALALACLILFSSAPASVDTQTRDIERRVASLLDRCMKRVVEPGAFDVMVGGSSMAVKTAALEVVAR